jgi:hypothetical protein
MVPQIAAENLYATEPLSSLCELEQQNIVVFHGDSQRAKTFSGGMVGAKISIEFSMKTLAPLV